MKVVWFCGLPEMVRQEIFSDLPLLRGREWSWIVGHLPPPDDIELHVICGDRRLSEDVTRTWRGTHFHLVKVPRGGPYLMYEGWAKHLARKSRELSPDIVHGWGTECAFSLAAIRAEPQRHIVGIQGILSVTWPVMKKNVPTYLCVINERRVLSKAKQCVAESHYSKETVSRFTRAQVDVVPQPLREDFLIADLGPRNEKIMIYLGVLAHRKGIYDAIRAFLRIESEWKLVCIGEPGSIEDKEELDALLKEKDPDNRVSLVGSQTSVEIINWFRRSPVLLLPTYTDTGPTALKEALAMGLWPICYKNTGPKELIGRYRVGSLVETGNIDQLFSIVEIVLIEKPWLDAEKMSAISQRIRRDLSPEVVWDSLMGSYKSLYQ